jgi:hypothetical protein
MCKLFLFTAGSLLISVTAILGQNPNLPYTNQVSDPAALAELQKISRSVQTMAESGRATPTERGESSKPGSLTDRQQKLVLSMEMLIRSEERVANFQSSTKIGESLLRLTSISDP